MPKHRKIGQELTCNPMIIGSKAAYDTGAGARESGGSRS